MLRKKKGFGPLLIIVIVVIIILIVMLLTGNLSLRSPISKQFFITDKGNYCKNLEPPTKFRDGDNQAMHIAEYGMPERALFTSVDNEHPWYSDYYKTCNAHNLQSPIVLG